MKTFKIDLFDLVTSLAKVVDVMSVNLADHHLKVAYLAYRIAQELGMSEEDQQVLAMTGALHDIGAFSLKERIDLLTFEDTRPGEHSLAGHLLLKNFKPFAAAAEIIKHHHLPWNDGKGAAGVGCRRRHAERGDRHRGGCRGEQDLPETVHDPSVCVAGSVGRPTMTGN